MEEVNVDGVMTRSPLETIDAKSTVLNAAEVMTQKERSCLIVLDAGKPVGIVTERDLVRKALAKKLDPASKKIQEIMSKPLVRVRPETPISEAVGLMAKKRIRRLAVVQGEELVGIVTVTDLAKTFRGRVLTEALLDAISRAPVG